MDGNTGSGLAAESLGVAVITPIGTFPSEHDLRRVQPDERIERILKLAAEKLELASTADWVATVDGKTLDPRKSFSQENLRCVVDIEYHKVEGGGGA